MYTDQIALDILCKPTKKTTYLLYVLFLLFFFCFVGTCHWHNHFFTSVLEIRKVKTVRDLCGVTERMITCVV